jgi:hypothetical protein
VKQPKSLAVQTFRASVTTTKRNRRFVICPNCSVIGAPVALGAERYTCKACGADIDLTAKPVPRKRTDSLNPTHVES